MRLRTINESISLHENFPPGAEHDSRAPYNQPSGPDPETKTIDAMVWDEGGENELPVKITYTYVEQNGKKYINKPSVEDCEFVNPEDKEKASSGLIDDIHFAIEEDAGDYEYV